MGAKWTDEEIKLVKKIWKSPVAAEFHMHLLPGRGIKSVYKMARALKLPAKPRAQSALPALIEKIMKDGTARTALELAKMTKRSPKIVRVALHEACSRSQMHICGYRGGYHEAEFIIGAGVNAEKPPKAEAKQIRIRHLKKMEATGKLTDAARDDALLDEKHRSRGYWWPKADPVVCGAMRAMVDAGRAQA